VNTTRRTFLAALACLPFGLRRRRRTCKPQPQKAPEKPLESLPEVKEYELIADKSAGNRG